MTGLNEILEEVAAVTSRLNREGCPDPYFRGQANSEWGLIPSLYRLKNNPRFHNNKEKRLFWDFRMQGSHLLPSGISEWDVLFYMQHHGIPTRLLDWSTSFANALHFAMKGQYESASIWILDPYKLNESNANGSRSVSSLNVSFKMDYCQFMDLKTKPPGALAISGDSRLARILSQQGMFTVHGEDQRPLEEIYPHCISKIVIPSSEYDHARSFLKLAGVNEFSIYPDLDGLARYLCARELGI